MLFCKGYLCAPWVFGETVAMLDNGEHICAGNCVGGCISTGIPCLNVYSLCTARQAIRKKYNIDGGCLDDVICGTNLCGVLQVRIVSLGH